MSAMLAVLVFLFLWAGNAYADLVPCTNNCGMFDFVTMALNIINLLLGLSGIVALTMIVRGGVQMLLSAGKPDKVAQGKSTITNALLGLTIALGAYLIINTVVATFTGYPELSGLTRFWRP